MVDWAKLPAIRCVLSTPVETVPATELYFLWRITDQLILGLSPPPNSRLFMAQEISWYWDSLRVWTVVFLWLKRSADIGTLSAYEQSYLLWLRRSADIGTFLFWSGRGSEITWARTLVTGFFPILNGHWFCVSKEHHTTPVQLLFCIAQFFCRNFDNYKI